MYVIFCTRPDIAGSCEQVSIKSHKGALERREVNIEILNDTSKMHLPCRRSNLAVQGFSDADLGGDLDGRKSTTGYIFTLGGAAQLVASAGEPEVLKGEG